MQTKLKKVLVIDGQGGGIGKSIVSALKGINVGATVVCVGTNAYAANSMKSAGADVSVYGEESVIACIKEADIISGPIGIIIPNSLKGEISERIAYAVADSEAVKILVPLNRCNIIVAGVKDRTLAENINEVALSIKEKLEQISLN